MGRNIWNIVLLTVLSSLLVCGHVYKDYTNNAVLLSSVYDAMKNNLQENIRNNLNQYDMLSDTRNKRNVNEKVEYYDALPSETALNEYVILFIVCLFIEKKMKNSISALFLVSKVVAYSSYF